MDVSAQFEGHNKAYYVATAAFAVNPTSSKSHFAAYAYAQPIQGPHGEITLVASSKKTQVSRMNFKKVLESHPTWTVDAELQFGNKSGSKSNVKAHIVMDQSSRRRDYVKQLPLAQLCEQQMNNGDNIQFACYNATNAAGYLDRYQVEINYEKLTPFWKNVTVKAYSAARALGWAYLDENWVNPSHQSQGKVSVNVQFAPNLQSVNVSMLTPVHEATFYNIRVNQALRPLLAANLVRQPSTLFFNQALANQYSCK